MPLTSSKRKMDAILALYQPKFSIGNLIFYNQNDPDATALILDIVKRKKLPHYKVLLLSQRLITEIYCEVSDDLWHLAEND